MMLRAAAPAASNAASGGRRSSAPQREKRSWIFCLSWVGRRPAGYIPPGGTMPSTSNCFALARPPVTSGAYASPRKPTSEKRPFALVRITNGGSSPS